MDIRRSRPDKGMEWDDAVPFLGARGRIDQARARHAARSGQQPLDSSHPHTWQDGRPRGMAEDRYDQRWLERDMPTRAPGEGAGGPRRPLGEMTAMQLMTTEVISVQEEASLAAVASLMTQHRIGMVPVLDRDRRPVGVVTDRDIVVRAVAEGRDLGTATVADVMSRQVECADLDESASEVVEKMGRRRVRRIPVVDDDQRVVGVVSIDDLAVRADDDQSLQRALGRTAARRSFWREEAWR